MISYCCLNLRRVKGFGLVEVMVGLLIGAIAAVAMLQVYSFSEGQKRTISGGVDAQTNVTIAVHNLKRDIGQSGYGIIATNLIGCDILLRTGVTLSAMAPVTINHASIPAGDANTDTLLIVYGTSAGSPEGEGIIGQPQTNMYSVSTLSSFAAGENVIAVPLLRPTNCTGYVLTMVTRSAPPYLTVITGVAGMTNGRLFDLGLSPTFQAYAVRNRNLTVCNYLVNNCGNASLKGDATVWVPIVTNIVGFRVQYGRDTSNPMDAIVDQYDQTTPASVCDWFRISALRLAVVASSNNYEKTAVTAAAPIWEGSVADTVSSPSNPTALAIDLAKNPDGSANNTWQNYRYSLAQTVVPIRNITWSGIPPGC